ncbi:hypothetical protein ACGFXC_08995 [Streptomyces sp. NPDC048507]|uniref:hypothetical protein n=1 Tax=Streptomyces sp. NPDC048507 TaxID=3365560 RepID=UPI0037112F45
MSTNPSREPGLSIRLDTGWFAGLLRADQIRRDTLTSLAVAWGTEEGRDDLVLQLDALAEAMSSARGDGELDHLLDAVEGAAGMDDAEVTVDLGRLLRLRAELDAAITVLARFNPAAARPVLLSKVPGQPERAA